MRSPHFFSPILECDVRYSTSTAFGREGLTTMSSPNSCLFPRCNLILGCHKITFERTFSLNSIGTPSRLFNLKFSFSTTQDQSHLNNSGWTPFIAHMLTYERQRIDASAYSTYLYERAGCGFCQTQGHLLRNSLSHSARPQFVSSMLLAMRGRAC